MRYHSIPAPQVKFLTQHQFRKMIPPPPTTPIFLPRMVRQICTELNSVNSVCLGLTSKRLYETHKAVHGTVQLSTWSTQYDKHGNKTILAPFLYARIKKWMSPNLIYSPVDSPKFVTKDRYKERMIEEGKHLEQERIELERGQNLPAKTLLD
jgi:hypothetical protein